jgi:1-acyl-sn-glycerol-3-phosphate acyltransferase
MRTLRLLRVGVHLAAGCAISEWLYPLLRPQSRQAVRGAWARALLEMLGVRLDAGALRVLPGSLVVANHISWLDAVALHALLPAAVVAKSEARRWPLIGRMLERNDTLFVERRACRTLLQVNAEIAARLARGESVAVFPEGTTTDGARLLPFRPALFQPAVAGGHPVRPLALAYRDGAGSRCAEAAYIGDMNLWQSLCAIAALPALTLEIRACGLISTRGLRRREAARLARIAVHSAGSASSAGWRPSSTGPTWASAAEVSRT